MSGKVVRFQEKLNLQPHLAGRAMVAYGICYDGSLAVLAADPKDKERMFVQPPDWPDTITVTPDPKNPGEVIVDHKPRPDATPEEVSRERESYERSVLDWQNRSLPCDITFMRFGKRLLRELLLPEKLSPKPCVQCFPDGALLLKTFFGETIIYGKAGTRLRALNLGDYAHIQVSEAGEIWTGYWDMSVLYKGRPGICRSTREGEEIWSLNPDSEICEEYGSIYDCYAMNVMSDCVWFTYFDHFPIMRVDQNGRLTAWKNEFSAADLIAADGKRVLLYGGYVDRDVEAIKSLKEDEDPSPYYEGRNGCIVQTLGDDGMMHDSVRYVLDLPGDLDGFSVQARGADLHCVVNGIWYTVNMSEFA